MLFKILTSYHYSQSADFDRLVSSCDLNDINCYHHLVIPYNQARQYMFGLLHLETNASGHYRIKDVYCSRYYEESDFPANSRPGPMRIPDSNILNTEHTWPQSHFSRKHPAAQQKGDLHALFPTGSSVNSSRGNNPFAEISDVVGHPCGTALVGFPAEDHATRYFEPPNEHKGNVARAIFYFSVRYELSIPPVEEAYLRQWNKLDPVDEQERAKNEAVFSIQKDRNPFVDYPELADLIDQM